MLMKFLKLMLQIFRKVGVDVVDEKEKLFLLIILHKELQNMLNSVLELKKAEFAQAGINKLIEDYPVLNDFLNYYIANGNSYEGFGEMKDRSGIQIDELMKLNRLLLFVKHGKSLVSVVMLISILSYLKDSGQLLEAC